ncbi:hypothetical protein ACFE04_009541 [Oxalis oulophora]
MDCNKDEAVKCKEIAERKVEEKDYAGAKKFITKAQNLYPGLDGLSQILIALNVYLSAENKIAGEVDWYGVLDINPSAEDDILKKQYRKLALVLHPDKNKSPGADGAFKLVSEAWSLLSDKTKRFEYNQKINSRHIRNIPSHGGTPSAPPSSKNGYHKSSSRERAQKASRHASPASVPAAGSRKPETFWTSCDKCKTHYEYLRIYQNHTLLCPNCNQPFLALPKAPPESVLMSTKPIPQNSPSHHAAGSTLFDFGRNCATSPPNNAHFNPSTFGHTSHSVAQQAASGVQRAQDNFKRDRDEPWAATTEWQRNQNSGIKAERLLKKKKIDNSNSMNWLQGEMASRMAAGWGHSNPELQSIYGAAGIKLKPNSRRELTLLETRNMLVKRATVEIHKKVRVWKIEEKKTLDKEKEKESKKTEISSKQENNKSAVSEELQSKTLSPGPSKEQGSINVPDSDFHNFDLDRTESSFRDDQVWASYDEDDGMPRYYARIHKVISANPFKVRISWLNSRTTSEFGDEINWVGVGFAKTSGRFRTGRHEISDLLNSFSHKVNWAKGPRGLVHIFPQKGDVWALYRNWSVDWNENIPDEVIHKYDMVEVLDDYSQEHGVSVTPLVKVAGFRTVFRKHTDDNKIRRIQKEEMFRFSHQVPSYLLTGEEAPNAPAGCRELDPAATPLELLQVITETDEANLET